MPVNNESPPNTLTLTLALALTLAQRPPQNGKACGAAHETSDRVPAPQNANWHAPCALWRPRKLSVDLGSLVPQNERNNSSAPRTGAERKEGGEPILKVVSLSYRRSKPTTRPVRRVIQRHPLPSLRTTSTLIQRHPLPSLHSHREHHDNGGNRHHEHAAGALERALVVGVGVAASRHVLVLSQPYAHLGDEIGIYRRYVLETRRDEARQGQVGKYAGLNDAKKNATNMFFLLTCV